MWQVLVSSLGPVAVQRSTLLVNHVIAGEPAAVARLLPHQGKRLKVLLTDWPAWMPAPPTALLRVTPAGLLEVDDGPSAGEPAGLELRIAAANPAGLVLDLARGAQPTVTVQGDAQFAGDIQWLADNLRWDLEGDLARLIGPLPARQLARLGSALRAALQRWAPAAGPQRAP